MRYTENLLLKKPDLADSPPDITVFNENWDKIDEMLKKLPVQNGGLYINDATTQEDKAEAQEALKNLGMFPVIDARTANFDMDIIIASGEHYALYKTIDKTLGTPYAKGITKYSTANILSCANSNSYAFQIAYISGINVPYTRTLNNGVVSDWTTGFLPLDGSVPMSGSVRFNGGKANINANDNAVITAINNADGKTRQLLLNSDTYRPNIAHLLQVKDISLGQTYTVYGTHNVTKGTESLTAKTSPLTTDCIYLQYE